MNEIDEKTKMLLSIAKEYKIDIDMYLENLKKNISEEDLSVFLMLNNIESYKLSEYIESTELSTITIVNKLHYAAQRVIASFYAITGYKIGDFDLRVFYSYVRKINSPEKENYFNYVREVLKETEIDIDGSKVQEVVERINSQDFYRMMYKYSTQLLSKEAAMELGIKEDYMSKILLKISEVMSSIYPEINYKEQIKKHGKIFVDRIKQLYGTSDVNEIYKVLSNFDTTRQTILLSYAPLDGNSSSMSSNEIRKAIGLILVEENINDFGEKSIYLVRNSSDIDLSKSVIIPDQKSAMLLYIKESIEMVRERLNLVQDNKEDLWNIMYSIDNESYRRILILLFGISGNKLTKEQISKKLNVSEEEVNLALIEFLKIKNKYIEEKGNTK